MSTANKLQAQAYTFSHGSNCYAVLPNHAAPRQLVSLLRGDPPVVGQGQKTSLIFPAMDLALATVTGPLSKTCNPNWTALSNDLSNIFRTSTAATLLSLRRNGRQQNVRMEIQSVSYEYITLEAIDAEDNNQLGQGRSGSTVMVGDTPVAIAINSNADKNPGQIKALRMDAIKNRLNRFITGAHFSAPIQAIIAPDKNTASINYTVDYWSSLPADPENGPENILADNGRSYIINQLDQTLKIDLRLPADTAQTVRKVTIRSNVADGTHTSPKKIALLASNSENKSRTRNLGVSNKEMSLSGEFVANVSTNTLWILVRIHSVWDQNKPIRIDSITIE